MRAFGLQRRKFGLRFGRQFRAAQHKIAQIVLQLGLLRRIELIERCAVFNRLKALVKRHILADFGEKHVTSGINSLYTARRGGVSAT